MLILWIVLGVIVGIWLVVSTIIWFAHEDMAMLRRKPKRDVLKLMLIWPFTLNLKMTWDTFTNKDKQREIREKANDQAFREAFYQMNPAKYKRPERRR